MDPLTAGLAVAAGCAVGLVAGLVPGIHANTVCAVALAVLPGAGPALAIALAAMAVAHAFAAAVPSTYLGAPGEDSLLLALPAHRMLLDGRGPAAVQASIDGGLAGLALGTILLLPYKWLLAEPGRLLPVVDAAMPWLLGAVLAFLVLREAPRGARAVAWAATVLALSGALGLVAGRTTVAALVDVPASSLLPLLSGLFGAPALIEALRTVPHVPPQEPARPPPASLRRRSRRGVVAGVGAAAATAILPGMTTAVAASAALAGRKEDDPRPVLATLSAIAVAQVVLAFGVLWLSGRARSGVAAAVQQLWPPGPWGDGAPPLPLQWIVLAAVASGMVAHLLVGALSPLVARWLPRLPARLLPALALAFVCGAVVVLSGPWGCAIFVVAIAVGLLPLAAGGRRIHLTGSLLVPVLAYRLGWA